MNIKAKGETSMLLKKALSLIPKEFPNSNREAAVSQHLKFVSFNKYLKYRNYVQVNLCQKLIFSHQLTHNMTIDCSLNYKFNT